VRSSVEHGNDLVAMLQRRYAGTNPHFLWNREFISTVKECQLHIVHNKDKSYVHLAYFNKTLKVNITSYECVKFWLHFIHGCQLL